MPSVLKGRLPNAPRDYDSSNESEFRGAVGRALDELTDTINELEVRSEFSSSGSGEIIAAPSDGSAYFSGNQVKAPGTGWTFYGSGTSGPYTWFDLDSGYSNTIEQEFDEDGTTGDLVYSGSDTKKFGVFYHGNFTGIFPLAFWSAMLRVQTYNGSWSVATGSTVTDEYYGYVVYLGSVFKIPPVSGQIIVSLSPGDKVKLQYGAKVSTSGNITGATFGMVESGCQLTIAEVGE